MARGESEVGIESVRDSSESEDVEGLSLESYYTLQPNRTIRSTNETDAHRGCAARSQSKSSDRMDGTADRVLRSSPSSLTETHATTRKVSTQQLTPRPAILILSPPAAEGSTTNIGQHDISCSNNRYNGSTRLNHTEAMSPLHSDPEGPGKSHQSEENLSISTSQQLLPPELPRTGAASPLDQETPDLGSAFPSLDNPVSCQQEQVTITSTDHLMLAPRPLSVPTSSAALRRGSAEKGLPTLVSPKTNFEFVLSGASHTAPWDGAETAREPFGDFGATADPATAWRPRNPSVNSSIHSPDRSLLSIGHISSDRQDQVGCIEVARLSSNAGLIQSEMGATDYWQERVATETVYFEKSVEFC